MKRYHNFGDTIYKLRTAKEFSQTELAKRIKVHGQYVSNVERGLCPLPKPALKKLIKALKVTDDEKVLLFNALIQDRIDQLNTDYTGILS